MADEQTTTTQAPEVQTPSAPAATPSVEAPVAEAKAKTVRDDMDSRRVLPNVAEAAAYITKCASDFTDFTGYPVAAPGVSVSAEGALVFDPAVYTDSMGIMVSVLTQRGDGPNQSTVKAIVIAPVPTFDSILADAGGKAWAERIIAKELNHVAVRGLRKADNIANEVPEMPTTLADYITSDRQASGILAAFEELWRPIKNNMAKLSRPWRLANFSKKELRRCFESAGYASEYYPTVEETKQGSLFVLALNGLVKTARESGLDPTWFERCLATRDEATIDVKDDDEEDEISIDALSAAMAAPTEEPTPAPATPPVEAPAQVATPPAA